MCPCDVPMCCIHVMGPCEGVHVMCGCQFGKDHTRCDVLGAGGVPHTCGAHMKCGTHPCNYVAPMHVCNVSMRVQPMGAGNTFGQCPQLLASSWRINVMCACGIQCNCVTEDVGTCVHIYQIGPRERGHWVGSASSAQLVIDQMCPYGVSMWWKLHSLTASCAHPLCVTGVAAEAADSTYVGTCTQV